MTQKNRPRDSVTTLIEFLENIIGDYFDAPQAKRYKNGCAISWLSKDNKKNAIGINERKGAFSVEFQLVPELVDKLPQSVYRVIEDKHLRITDWNNIKYFKLYVKHNNQEDFKDLEDVAKGYVSVLI